MSVADIARALAGAVALFAVLAAVFRNADRRLPAEITRPVAEALRHGQRPARAQAGALAAAVLDAAIGPGRPARAMLLGVLRNSALGLLLASIFCLMAIPEYATATLGSWNSAVPFLTRFGLEALITVLLVTWASAAVTGHLAGRLAAGGGLGGVVGLIAVDLAVRFVALVLVTAASFALFAKVTDSFGGSPRTAMTVIPETLRYALAFAGLSGIFVYASLLNGFALWLALPIALSARHAAFAAAWRRLGRALPLGARPVRFFGILLGAAAALLAFALALVVAAGSSMR